MDSITDSSYQQFDLSLIVRELHFNFTIFANCVALCAISNYKFGPTVDPILYALIYGPSH